MKQMCLLLCILILLSFLIIMFYMTIAISESSWQDVKFIITFIETVKI